MDEDVCAEIDEDAREVGGLVGGRGMDDDAAAGDGDGGHREGGEGRGVVAVDAKEKDMRGENVGGEGVEENVEAFARASDVCGLSSSIVLSSVCCFTCDSLDSLPRRLSRVLGL